MNRRDFLHSITSLATLSLLEGCIAPVSKLAKGQDPFKGLCAHFYFSSSGNIFELTDNNGKSILKISPPQTLVPHSFIRSSARPELIGGSEKWKKHIYIIDLVSKTFKSSRPLKEKESYGGHLLFSPDGKYIYAGLNNYDQKPKGYLSIIEVNTLREIDRLPTLGVEPHDMRFISGENKFFMLHSGVSLYDVVHDTSKIIIFDMNKAQIEDTITIPDNSTHVAHVAPIDDRQFFLTGSRLKDPTKRTFKNNICNAVVKFDINRGIISLDQQNSDTIQTEPLLSSAYSAKKNVLACTSPGDEKIYIWDTKTLKPIKTIHIPKPMSICLNSSHSHFIVGTLGKGLFHIDSTTLNVSKENRKIPFTFTSHSLLIT